MPASGERGHADASLRARVALHAGDEAVSPVVGTILVLAVSVVGIVATLYWGLPAIDEMKANVEVRSVKSQLMEFLADIQELSAGTAGKTAKHFQPSLQRGALHVDAGTEKWIIAMDMGHATAGRHDFYWSPYGTGTPSDTDRDFVVYNSNATLTQTTGDVVKAFLMNGAAEEQIAIRDAAYATCSGIPGTITSITGGWAAGTSKEFTLCRNVGGSYKNLDLNQNTVRIEIYDDNVLIAKAWFMDLGKLQYTLAAGLGAKDLVVTNGALIEGTNGQYVFNTAPPIPPPKTTSSSHRWFGRVVELNGTASFGGSDRFDMILNLYGTGELGDVDCDRTVITTCVVSVKIYPLGDLKDVWTSYFRNPSNGYTDVGYNYAERTNALYSGATGMNGEEFVIDRVPAGMSFTLIRSVITASG